MKRVVVDGAVESVGAKENLAGAVEFARFCEPYAGRAAFEDAVPSRLVPPGAAFEKTRTERLDEVLHVRHPVGSELFRLFGEPPVERIVGHETCDAAIRPAID